MIFCLILQIIIIADRGGQGSDQQSVEGTDADVVVMVTGDDAVCSWTDSKSRRRSVRCVTCSGPTHLKTSAARRRPNISPTTACAVAHISTGQSATVRVRVTVRVRLTLTLTQRLGLRLGSYFYRSDSESHVCMSLPL